MKKLFFLLMALPLCSHAQSTLTPKGAIIPATDKHIQYVGRVSFKNPQSPMFTFPGVQINSGFQGTSLKMIAKPQSGYFMAQIDGAEPFKVGFNTDNDSIVSLATALPYGNHQVKLMYIIEGYERRPEFRGFILDKGCTLTDAPALPERKIEFIGNSITCGYGVESFDPNEHFNEATENHYYTYAAITARNLEAQHVTIARSGIGIYRNYAGPKTGNPDNMPNCYEQTLLYDKTQPWDFNRFTPNVVCVNLGTNDTSTKGYDKKLLLDGYRNFIKKLRSHYPNAKIVMLTGVMLDGESLEDVKNALNTAVKEENDKGDKEIYRFDMTPHADRALRLGADYHPSYWQQQKMAGELTAFLRSLMQWF